MLIDVSKWNGNINWTKAKSGGVDGVIIRCAVGTGTDTKFYSNIDGALAAGIKVGVYVYSKAKGADQAVSEAEHALTILKPYEGKLYYPVFIDSEENSTKAYAKASCQAFINKIINDGRFRAGVYCSSSWFKTNIKSLSGNYTKWIAQWSSKQPSCDIWQYSSKGKVNGISGDVDMDKVISYNPTPTPIPEPTGGCYMFDVSVVKKGTSGADTLLLQRILYSMGFKGANGKPLALDGNCGNNTVYAINSCQTYLRKHGIEVGTNGHNDNMCGAKMWKALLNT